MKNPTGVDITQSHTPNCSAWTFGEKNIKWIATHTPEGSYDGTVGYLRTPGVQASYHLLVEHEGKGANQLVPFEKKAWHALDNNTRMESVSLCCYTGTTAKAGEDALARLIAWRLLARGLPPIYDPYLKNGQGFCRHGDLQRDRRDPMTELQFRSRVVPKVKSYYKLYKLDNEDPGAVLRNKTGYYSFEKWIWGYAEWAEFGAKNDAVRPNIPKRIKPVWWAKLRRRRWQYKKDAPWYPAWADWYIGVGEFSDTRPRDQERRPKGTPREIPKWAWKRLQKGDHS